MTGRHWGMTFLAWSLSVGGFVYCIYAVTSAWGLVSLGLLLVLSFRLLLDTVDLLCGHWFRGTAGHVAAGPVTIRRIIVEEIAVGAPSVSRPLPNLRHRAVTRRDHAGSST